MTDDSGGLPRWHDPAWRSEASDWVRTSLAAAGRQADLSRVEVRSRPWSTVWRVPAEQGDVWFKANAVGTAYEAGLVAALARWAPVHVLQPLAVDPGRGWQLLPDGGRTLRAAQAGTPDLAVWERMLVGYAALQRALEPRVPRLLDLGVPDSRPEVLPAVLDRLLADDTALLTGRPEGMTTETRTRLRSAAPAYARLCSELAGIGVPASLQHDDLHDGNVFESADHTGPAARIFDWGDASVAHPFGTLLVTLRVLGSLTGLQPGAPELLRLRDAYLEAWSGDHDVADLREACRLALRVGAVVRAAAWHRALVEATADGLAAWGEGVPGWLAELFEPTPVDAEPFEPVLPG